MALFAGLEIPGRTVRFFCPYPFSIRTTAMKAIRPQPIHMFPRTQPIQRRHSRLPMSEVTMNCVLPTCKALVMP